LTGNAILRNYGCVKSTGGRTKNGIFRGYTVKNDRNRHENDVYCGRSIPHFTQRRHDVQLITWSSADSSIREQK